MLLVVLPAAAYVTHMELWPPTHSYKNMFVYVLYNLVNHMISEVLGDFQGDYMQHHNQHRDLSYFCQRQFPTSLPYKIQNCELGYSFYCKHSKLMLHLLHLLVFEHSST